MLIAVRPNACESLMLHRVADYSKCLSNGAKYVQLSVLLKDVWTKPFLHGLEPVHGLAATYPMYVYMYMCMDMNIYMYMRC